MNGLYTRRLEFSYLTEQVNIKGLTNFIKYDDKTLVFLGYTEFVKYNNYFEIISNTINQLKPLNNSARLNVQPERIKIVKVENEEIFENILKKYGYTQEKCKKIAILNGMELTTKVEKGTSIKIVLK